MHPIGRRILVVALVAATVLGLAASAVARTTTVQPDVSPEFQAFLDRNGMTTETWLEVADDPAKLPARCWHAKLFAAIRGPNGGRNVWAWEKGIICSLNGRIDEAHLRHDRGSRGIWQDGPQATVAYQHRLPRTCCHVYSHYENDWRYGSGWQRPIWAVRLNLHQYWSKRVDRKVAWHEEPSS